MPDDIFDYFGGSSSRKVEPLDENEMFDDLLPGKQEIDTAADSESAAETEVVDAELVAESVDDFDEVNESAAIKASAESADEPDQDDDPWSDLASSLGLDPTPAKPAKPAKPADPVKPAEPVVPRTSVVLGEVGLVADLGAKEEPEPEVEKQDRASAADVFERDEGDDQEQGMTQEVVSESFVPNEDPEVYSQREMVDDWDDDPFAAFSGSARRAVDDTPDSDLEDIDDDLDIDSEIEIDPDFVEFEVKDLGGRVDQEREERTGRRPRRRRRGRGDDDTRETAPSDDRPEQQQAKRSDDRGDSRNRRSGRPRSGESVPQQDEVADETKGNRQAGDRTRQRDRGQRAGESADDDRMQKKKPRIPTWQEAIGVIVDENIKRHESGASAGRGGRRRRKN